MNNSLLPPNATRLEKDLSEVSSRIDLVPVDFEKTWNPYTCPPEFLPWLGWAFSVDEWNDGWTTQQKRDFIASSSEVHRKKGTAGAVKKAVAALGYDSQIVEWFQNGAEAYTFDIRVDVSNEPLTETQFQQLRRLVEQTKNARSHFALIVSATMKGAFNIASGVQIADTVQVQPYVAENIELTTSTPVIALGVQIFDNVEITG